MRTEAELERPNHNLRNQAGISPGMGVFTTDRERVGVVERATEALIHLSGTDPSANRYPHSFPIDWVDWVDGNHVYLNKGSGYVFKNWNGPKVSRAVNAARIVPYLQVYSSDDIRVGAVERQFGLYEMLLKKDEHLSHGHHAIPFSWVDRVDVHMHLNKPAAEVRMLWKAIPE